MRLAKGFFLPFLAAEIGCSALPSGHRAATVRPPCGHRARFLGAVLWMKITFDYFNRHEKLMFIIG